MRAAGEVGPRVGLFARLSKSEPQERSAVLAAFAAFFCLLATYYVLRPIRDEMALQLGPRGLQRLFDAVFLTMLAVVPAFGWLVRRYPRRKVLPWVYGFFVLDLVAFYPWLSPGAEQTPAVARVFYVWVSVFAATGVAVFWSLMADVFTQAQAKRVYGFIAAGGTAGALVGPALTASLVSWLGVRALVLVAALFLVGTIVSVSRLRERGRDAAAAAEAPPVAGSVWSGLIDVARSPLLLGICSFVFLFTLLSTFLYFRTAEILPRLVPSGAARTALLAKTDGAVNLLSLTLQLLVFPRLLARFGLRFTLALMPAISMIGFVALAGWPGLAPLIAFGVARRAGEFALSKPAREILFNALSAEEKYKAKNVIDTLIYRAGDEASSRALGGLRTAGVSSGSLTWAAAGLSAVWMIIGWRVGRRGERPPETISGS